MVYLVPKLQLWDTYRRNNRKISIGIVSDSFINLSEQEKEVLDFMKKNNRITSKDVANILDLKEARARRVLKQMVDKEIISRLGSGRSTYYRKQKKDI